MAGTNAKQICCKMSSASDNIDIMCTPSEIVEAGKIIIIAVEIYTY